MTHLGDTYEGAGEHDGLVIAVALAGWRVLPVGRRKSLPDGCHEGGPVFVKQGWGTRIFVEFNDGQGNVGVGSARISRSGGPRGVEMWRSPCVAFLATRTVGSAIEVPIASQVLTGSEAACRSTFVNRLAAFLGRRNCKKQPSMLIPFLGSIKTHRPTRTKPR